MTAVGEIVWFNPGAHETVMTSDQPLAAIVTYVHPAAATSPAKVNLAVFGKNGDQWQKHGMPFWDGDGDPLEARLSFAYPAGTALVYPDAAPVSAPPASASSAVMTPTKVEKPAGAVVATEGVVTPVAPPADTKPLESTGAQGGAAVAAPAPWSPPSASEWDSAYADYDGDDAPALVSPPVGDEYKPDAPNPAPNAPEPVNKVPADSPANPARPLD